MGDERNLLVLLLVLGARLVVPLAIPRYPIPGGIAALVIDGIDQTVFQAFTTLDLAGYQSYDKALDIYYLSIAYLSTLRNWTNLSAFDMSRFLYYFRLVGSLLFELLHVRAILLLFPNTFEYFFLFYEAVRLRWNPRRLSAALVIGAAFAIWVFIKVPQEYWIHIAQLDVTDALKVVVFGAALDTPWGTVLAEHVPLLAGLVLASIALVVILRWAALRYLPPADWRFSFAADAHGRDVTNAEARAAQEASARRLFDAELYEKVVLVSLVTVIFSRILPGLQATVTQTALGAALIILANTAVSEWWIRRGVVWGSAWREFLVMAATNIVAAALIFFLLPLGGGRSDPGATLFDLLLLTLLVTLYDRFRPFYTVRAERARETRREGA